MVGAGRFERPTPCAQGRCATRLRYAPTFYTVHFKLLLDPLQELVTSTVPKPCQNVMEGPNRAKLQTQCFQALRQDKSGFHCSNQVEERTREIGARASRPGNP